MKVSQDDLEKRKIQILVAGLLIGASPIKTNRPATVPVKIEAIISANSAGGARVLNAQGRQASDIPFAIILKLQ